MYFFKGLFSNRAVLHEVPAPPDSAPLSIHPEPRYFVDARTNPLARICSVIDVSDGGVIGITGDRGAGKSVLLRKIGERFAEGNLTITVSSPISGSKEMEFFLMLFRQLVQQVMERLRSSVDHYADDIRTVGQQALRKDRWRTSILTLCFACLAAFTSLALYDRYLLNVQLDKLNSEYDQLNAQIQALPAGSPDYGVLTGKYSYKNLQISNTKSLLPLAGSQFARSADQRRIVNFLMSLTWSLAALVIVLLGYRAANTVLNVMLGLYRSSAEERGLLTDAQQLATQLDYELTRTTDRSIELSPFSWLKGATKRSDQRKARALSLPELTSSYIRFIKNVRRVFPGKIIVCIDELDKIPSVEEIAGILREIKGALYVEGTFYLLSISNDAMRSFDGRMGDTRDIFESTFDDVFPVRALELEPCIAILKRRMDAGTSELRDSLHDEDALSMIAIFAAGNARDLIRCFRESVLSGIAGELPNSAEIWSLLYARRLDAIRDRAVVAGGSPKLRSILLPKLKPESVKDDWKRKAMTRTRRELRTYLDAEETPPGEKEVALKFVRYAAEMEILLLAREIPGLHTQEQCRRAASYLMTSYQTLPLSLTDCEDLLEEYPGYLADSQVAAPSAVGSMSSVLDQPMSDRHF